MARFSRLFKGVLLSLSLSILGSQAVAKDVIKVGEINSYKTIPSFLEPYRKGIELAVHEVNEAGGLLGGKKLEIIIRDDGGNPGAAGREAQI